VNRAEHPTIPSGIPDGEYRLREGQEIKAADDRWRRVFLHEAAASAEGIPALNFTTDFN